MKNTICALAFLLATSLPAQTPLTEMGGALYTGNHPGGLYEKGSNEMPADHAAAGKTFAERVVPRDREGRVSESGRIVLLAVGSPVAGTEFEAFRNLALQDRLTRSSLVVLNGAIAGESVEEWDDWRDPGYAMIERNVLAPAGVSEQQVQVVWVQAGKTPEVPLPVQWADAYRLEASLAATSRALKKRYPNLQLVYMSSEIFGGYANREPFAYEGAFAVRWVIDAQLEQVRTGYNFDVRDGDMDYRKGFAPWVGWGPYLWANGSSSRGDGLRWNPEDFLWDGKRLSESGAQKAAEQLLRFFKTEPTARSWFLSALPVRTRAVGR